MNHFTAPEHQREFDFVPAFKKVLVPVHEKMAGRIGKETVDAVHQAVGFTK